jgi:catechol 2,3-dioxygenase-like lactoylglutathione lyase family enzyme
MLNSVTPFFIIDDLSATLAFYQSKLGFDVRYKGGGDGAGADFWAIMGRDQVMLNFKAITPEVHPQPNHSRYEWARWDAYIHTDDPDALYQEFTCRQVPMHRELANTSDGLRAFGSSITTDTCCASAGRRRIRSSAHTLRKKRAKDGSPGMIDHFFLRALEPVLLTPVLCSLAAWILLRKFVHQAPHSYTKLYNRAA